jgi:hypothetical protein
VVRGIVEDDFRTSGGARVLKVLVSADDGNRLQPADVGTIPTAGSKVPGHDGLVPSRHDFTVEVTGAGEHTGRADFNVIAFDGGVRSA